AGEGIGYSLQLSVQGDDFVNPYQAAIPYLSATVTRIKWNTLPPFVYIDGTFPTLWGIPELLPMYVETETATVGGATRYRFKNVYRVATSVDVDGIYDGYPYNDPGDFDETTDYYTFLEIDKNGSVTMIPHEIGVAWSTYGMFSIGSIYGYVSSNLASYPLGKLEGKKITFPASSLYISMANYNNGNKYVASTPTLIYLTKEAYIEDNMKIEDFNTLEYEIIPGAISEYESASFGDSWGQTLAKAIDIDEANENSEYKNLYYLGDLYQMEYGLAFYSDGEAVTIPAKQPIGLEIFGQALYVSQSEKVRSSVTTNAKGVTVYTFGLQFHYADGTILGDFAEQFYYSENAVSYTIDDFYGNFKLTGATLFTDGTDANMNVAIAAGQTPNSILITGVRYAASIQATFEPATSTLAIAPQVLANYGQYDMTLYTFVIPSTISQTAILRLGFNAAGSKLEIARTSEADGYILRSQAAGGYVDGYYNIVLTPQIAKQQPLNVKRATPDVLTSKAPKEISIPEAKKLDTNNFSIQGKANPRQLKDNAPSALPF
ncbi:MAG: hypothetical protein LBS46_04205, partial [Dysgonamonadaceae bacterium]|nr:hypothetical protein [Dysgonamonadaceae bacterium]